MWELETYSGWPKPKEEEAEEVAPPSELDNILGDLLGKSVAPKTNSKGAVLDTSTASAPKGKPGAGSNSNNANGTNSGAFPAMLKNQASSKSLNKGPQAGTGRKGEGGAGAGGGAAGSKARGKK
jgi:hypothetical protein